MGNIEEVRIGAVSATLGGVDLGHSKDGAEFEFEREFEDLVVDKYGSIPIDMALTGQNLTVKLFLAEPNVDRLNTAIPESDHAVAGEGERLGLGTDAGELLRQYAKELVLHPLRNAAADDSEDVHIYQAVPVETVSLAYKIDEQRIIEVTFRALLSETYGSGRRLGHVGSADVS